MAEKDDYDYLYKSIKVFKIKNNLKKMTKSYYLFLSCTCRRQWSWQIKFVRF